jgi:Bacterial TSP3 repeat
MPDPDPDATRSTPVQNFEPARRHVGQGPDSDNDGLSDDFERNVFHSDPNQRDADGDGLSDWAEYWVDTNPNNADTDGDQWTDGEDLAFGDPLAANAGGAARAKFLADARRQFDAEGSDRDKDFARDHLEKEFGTSGGDPDSDNDGLGDMIELQLKTNPMSPADDTSDLDAAREQLGERRWAAEEAARQTRDSGVDPGESTDSTAATGDDSSFAEELSGAVYAAAAVAEQAYAEPAYDQPAYESPVDDGAAPDGGFDGGGDEGTFDGFA